MDNCWQFCSTWQIRRFGLAVTLGGAFLVYVWQWVLAFFFFEPHVSLSDLPEQNDFFHYYRSAVAALAGEQVYCREFILPTPSNAEFGVINVATNPPLLVLFTAPLGLLTADSAWVVWQLLNLLFTICAVGVICRVAKQPWPVAFFAALIVCLSNPTISGARYGQVQSLMLLLLMGVMVAALVGRDRTAGVILGLSIALKIFTLPLLFMFAGLGRYKLVLTATLWAFLLNVPFLFSGNLSIFDFQRCGGAEISRWAAGVTGNQSGLGLLKNVFSAFYAQNEVVISVMRSAFEKSSQFLLLLPCLIVFLFAVRLSKMNFVFLYCVSIIFVVVLSPLAWMHYYILIVPCILFALFSLNNQLQVFTYSVFLFFTAPLLPITFSFKESPINPTGDELAMRLLSWSSTVAPAVLFLIGLACLVHRWRERIVVDAGRSE